MAVFTVCVFTELRLESVWPLRPVTCYDFTPSTNGVKGEVLNWGFAPALVSPMNHLELSPLMHVWLCVRVCIYKHVPGRNHTVRIVYPWHWGLSRDALGELEAHPHSDNSSSVGKDFIINIRFRFSYSFLHELLTSCCSDMQKKLW